MTLDQAKALTQLDAASILRDDGYKPILSTVKFSVRERLEIEAQDVSGNIIWVIINYRRNKRGHVQGLHSDSRS